MNRFDLETQAPIVITHPEAGEYVLLPGGTLLTKDFREIPIPDRSSIPYGDQWSLKGKVIAEEATAGSKGNRGAKRVAKKRAAKKARPRKADAKSRKSKQGAKKRG